VLPYDKVFNVQNKALLGVRQFVCHNLKEKLHRIPKLSFMEKKWLVFQLMCATAQVHSVKMVHGDGEDDLKTYNLYFGELDNNQRCYIAPERFRSEMMPDRDPYDQVLLEPSMDIFSIGCIIAEIFMDRKDGRALFDLA
jgi:phosphoinositide-3-kinase, regulatory subunit 4